MRLEVRNEHEQAQIRSLFRSVFEAVDGQLEAGATQLVAETVEPQEGELFRAVVRSELMTEPKVISVRDSENDP